jgi:hypothetical protein
MAGPDSATGPQQKLAGHRGSPQQSLRMQGQHLGRRMGLHLSVQRCGHWGVCDVTRSDDPPLFHLVWWAPERTERQPKHLDGKTAKLPRYPYPSTMTGRATITSNTPAAIHPDFWSRPPVSRRAASRSGPVSPCWSMRWTQWASQRR